METKKSIAIIGGGVSGLTAGYLLHNKYDISLFEKTNQLGGNAYTFKASKGEEVDIAVAAFGKAGYPNFYKLLKKLDVKTSLCITSYMSFHNLETKKGLYLTPTLKGLWAQKFSLFNPKNLISVYRLFSGVRKGKKLNKKGEFNNLTMEDALKQLPQIKGDARTILISALCLMSSMSAAAVYKAPATFFFNKLVHHSDVVSLKAAWSVRAMTNGTRSYIQKLADTFRENITLNSTINKVTRNENKVTLLFDNDTAQEFDHVIFACHADHAYKMLDTPTPLEDKLLGIWKYKDGPVIVHRDASSFPARPLSQAYTFLYDVKDGVFNTSVNGALWHEPGVDKNTVLFSSQHPNFPIKNDLIELNEVLRTPIFDFNTTPITNELPQLNGKKNSYYCGSYFGFGLHEDAITSAINVAEMLGVKFE